MKKLLALLALGLVAFAVMYREQLFLWDPIASVTRDGVKQDGVRVMINYSNDVLVEEGSKLYLVQNWDSTAKFALGPLRCVQYLACMTDADHAAGEALRGRVSMTNRVVEFLDESGKRVSVRLR